MFCFAKNDHKIIAKCKFRDGGDVLAPEQVDGAALIGILNKFGIRASQGQKK